MKDLLDPKIKFSKFDLDKDGVINQLDCNPYDPKKQDWFGKPSSKTRLLRGYNIQDYYFDATLRRYVLIPGAKKIKRR